ncbi:hypothetical protein BC826DRAFT_1113176 [Russula brevipes]|nr:hypothetical protein BC826DRAFT_1113176 [Russula brevipes]
MDHLDKANAPPILEVYIYLLGMQCLVSLSDGLAAPKASASLTKLVRAPSPLDPSTLPEIEPARANPRSPPRAPLSRSRGSHSASQGVAEWRAATTAGAQPTQSDMRTCSRRCDFGIARLGGVAALNMQRLVHCPSDVVWDAITSHLLFILPHPAALQPTHVQAAHTLDDILAIMPRHLAATPSNLQAAVQRRVLNVLSQQVKLDGTAPSTSMELRCLGLEAPHQILPGSPSSLVGKLYLKCPAASAGAPLPRPSTPSLPGAPRSRPLPLRYLQEKGYSALIKTPAQGPAPMRRPTPRGARRHGPVQREERGAVASPTVLRKEGLR